MQRCPQCLVELEEVKTKVGILFACGRCGGAMVSMAVLRRTVQPETLKGIWRTVSQATATGPRPCPSCGGAMVQVPAAEVDQAPILDVCPHCQIVWFDANEYDLLPKVAPSQDAKETMSAKAREALAMIRIQRMQEEAEETDTEPEHWWQQLPLIIGLPVKLDAVDKPAPPYATWAITAVILAVSVPILVGLGKIDDLAMVPERWWRQGGLTLISSFFVHSGWIHLAGNLYFLVILGDEVEEVLGPVRWLFLLLLGTLMGDAFHLIMDPSKTRPLVGASGGISALIAFYALRMPRARLRILIGSWSAFRALTLPAGGWFFIWVVYQLMWAVFQAEGFGNGISSLAHLGGMLAGVAFWMIERNRDQRTEKQREA